MTRCVYLTFFGEYRGHGHGSHGVVEVEAADHDPVRHARVHCARLRDARARTRATVSTRFPSRHREVLQPSSRWFFSFPHFSKFEDYVAPGWSRRVPRVRLHRGGDQRDRAREHLRVDRRHRRMGIFWAYKREELGCTEAASPSATSSRVRGYSAASSTSSTSTYLYETDHRRLGIKGPIASRRVLVQPERDRRRDQLCVGRGTQCARARFVYDVRRPEGRSTVWLQRHVAEAHRRDRRIAALPARSRPVACSATHCSCSRRWGSSASCS